MCGDSDWDVADAQVVCARLGYNQAHVLTWTTSSEYSKWMYAVRCVGDESSLQDCPHQTSYTYCSPASVVCSHCEYHTHCSSIVTQVNLLAVDTQHLSTFSASVMALGSHSIAFFNPACTLLPRLHNVYIHALLHCWLMKGCTINSISKLKCYQDDS